MAVNRLPDEPSVAGNYRTCIAQVDGSSSYTTGGTRLYASDFGLQWIYGMVICSIDSTGTYFAAPLFTTTGPLSSVLVMWLTAANMTQVNNATDLSASSLRIIVIGK